MFKVQNMRDPIVLEGWNADGICGSSVRKGEKVRIIDRISTTSDAQGFHEIVTGLQSHIDFLARDKNLQFRMDRVNDVLVVIDVSNVAQIWLDGAAVAATAIVKKNIEALSPIYANNIADIIEIYFPDINVKENDRLIYLFREGWRFALYFDLKKAELKDVRSHWRELAHLTRQLRFHNLYEKLGDKALLDKLIELGWFPFIEIQGQEFQRLLLHIGNGWDILEVEEGIIKAFDESRLEHMFNRWMSNEVYASKRLILRSGIDSFKRGDYISCIKTLITEIEGVISKFSLITSKSPQKGKSVPKYIAGVAVDKVGHEDSLIFAQPFRKFLEKRIFVDTDYRSGVGEASSRNSVSHGYAEAESYNAVIALQVVLCLDQIRFCM